MIRIHRRIAIPQSVFPQVSLYQIEPSDNSWDKYDAEYRRRGWGQTGLTPLRRFAEDTQPVKIWPGIRPRVRDIGATTGKSTSEFRREAFTGDDFV